MGSYFPLTFICFNMDFMVYLLGLKVNEMNDLCSGKLCIDGYKWVMFNCYVGVLEGNMRLQGQLQSF